MAKQGIDFSQKTSFYREKEKQKDFLKNSIWAIVVIGIAFGSYVLTMVYNKIQDSKVTEIENKIASVKKNRDYQSISEIVDISSRLNFAGEMSQKQIMWSEVLKIVEDSMMKNSYLESFEGSLNFQSEELEKEIGNDQNNTISLEIISPNLTETAKQIHSFEQLEGILRVTVEEVDIDEKGVNYLVDLEIDQPVVERAHYFGEQAGTNLPSEEEIKEQINQAQPVVE
jgi:hypothetical protein